MTLNLSHPTVYLPRLTLNLSEGTLILSQPESNLPTQ